MARSAFILIAAIAVVSFITQPAAGQFPKISLPKIIKKETPAPTPNPDADRPASADTPANREGDVRGVPIAGAKIIFSASPDMSNPKTSFNSSENIYGRIDFGGKTMYDAFGWKAMGNRDFYYVSYWVDVKPEGSNQGWEHDWHNGRGYTYVSKEEAQKTYWDFDVLPEPEKATTRNSAIADEADYYKGAAGLWPKIRDMDNARRIFPKNGTYIVDMTIYGDSYDDWGKPAGNYETYKTVSAKFPFQFSGSDGQRLASGYEKAFEAIEKNKSRKEMYKAMPDWWGKSWKGTEPKLAPARLVPMIKGFLGRWNLTYLKHMIWDFTGPTWIIQKNDVGIPRYRMVNTTIYVMYKDPRDSTCKVGGLTMQETYSGAGTYGEPYVDGISDIKLIDCAVIK